MDAKEFASNGFLSAEEGRSAQMRKFIKIVIFSAALIVFNSAGLASGSTLFRNIVQERDVFIRFGVHFGDENILCETMSTS